MGLTVRIAGVTISDDRTLGVSYVVAWADEGGAVMWAREGLQWYSGAVTAAQVLSDLQEIAEKALPQIQAAADLAERVDVVYALDHAKGWIETRQAEPSKPEIGKSD